MIPLNHKETSPVDVAGMMGSLGYKNRAKFLRRLEEWQELWGKIPLKFLEMLCIPKEDLHTVLEFDKQDYFEAVKHCKMPQYFQYRVMPAVYPVKKLPDGATEEQAAAYAVGFLRSQPGYIQQNGAWINYGGLRTLWINTDGTIKSSLYVPAILFEDNSITFKTQTMAGSVRIL
jgi:hypothetical protein